MRIVIPTYRRCDNQRTLLAIPKEWLKQTTLVVDRTDFVDLGDRMDMMALPRVHMLVVPKSVRSIADKRAWILKYAADDKILMLDDDLRFARREYIPLIETLGNVKFTLVAATSNDIGWAFQKVEKALSLYDHVGISARQGNNRKDPVQWEANGRMMYALGYNVEAVRLHCELGRIQHREDMELCLQLLTAGRANRVLLDVCVDNVYNQKGGASEERSVEASNADAEKLAKMYPGLVKVVEKDYKASVPRKEVVCYWKKAYEKGIQRG